MKVCKALLSSRTTIGVRCSRTTRLARTSSSAAPAISHLLIFALCSSPNALSLRCNSRSNSVVCLCVHMFMSVCVCVSLV